MKGRSAIFTLSDTNRWTFSVRLQVKPLIRCAGVAASGFIWSRRLWISTAHNVCVSLPLPRFILISRHVYWFKWIWGKSLLSVRRICVQIFGEEGRGVFVQPAASSRLCPSQYVTQLVIRELRRTLLLSSRAAVQRPPNARYKPVTARTGMEPFHAMKSLTVLNSRPVVYIMHKCLS